MGEQKHGAVTWCFFVAFSPWLGNYYNNTIHQNTCAAGHASNCIFHILAFLLGCAIFPHAADIEDVVFSA